jgi:hypothetical protein
MKNNIIYKTLAALVDSLPQLVMVFILAVITLSMINTISFQHAQREQAEALKSYTQYLIDAGITLPDVELKGTMQAGVNPINSVSLGVQPAVYGITIQPQKLDSIDMQPASQGTNLQNPTINTTSVTNEQE